MGSKVVVRKPNYQPIKITKLGSTVRLDCATGQAQIEVTNHEDMNELSNLLNKAGVKRETEEGKPSTRTYYHGKDGRSSEEVKKVFYVVFDYFDLASKAGNFLGLEEVCKVKEPPIDLDLSAIERCEKERRDRRYWESPKYPRKGKR